MTDQNDERITAETQRTQRAAEEDLKEENELTKRVIACAIEVHRTLGPGLIETAYEECMTHELISRGIKVERQLIVPISYKEIRLATTLRLDLLVGSRVVLELKAIDAISPVHEAQLLTYLRITNLRVGLLINFNVKVLRDGIRRKVLTLRPSASSASLR